MDSSETVRLFIATAAPERWHPWIARTQHLIELAVPGQFRWTSRTSWHLTVLFLGAQPAGDIPSIIRAVEQTAQSTHSFTLTAGEIGAPPPRNRPRLLWLQCDDQAVLAGAKLHLQESLGLTPPREAPFRAHVTLARTNRPRPIPSTEILAAVNRTERPAPARISELHLYRSHLEPQGARYEILARASLKD